MLIVGGGPVGLTLAWRLICAGFDARVYEADPGISDQLRASTFHPPTLDMLQSEGITAQLLEHGRVTPTWQVRIHESGEKVQFDLAVLAGLTGHPYRLQCHQKVLSDALCQRLSAAGVPPNFLKTVVAVGQDKQAAWIDLEDGQRLYGAFVVGCDGARSVVRRTIGGQFSGTTYPEVTVLTTTRFPFEQVMPDLSGVNYIWKQGGTFSLLRLPDVWRCSFQAKPDQSPSDVASQAALRAHLREVLPEHVEQIEPIEQRPYRVHRRLASKWRDRRLFIAGDAAHLNSPKGGMGLNGGIHDAFELAKTLGAALRGSDDTLLDRYEARRKPIVASEIIGQADDNRARMALLDGNARDQELARLQLIADSEAQARAFLKRSSMIEGLEKAANIR